MKSASSQAISVVDTNPSTDSGPHHKTKRGRRRDRHEEEVVPQVRNLKALHKKNQRDEKKAMLQEAPSNAENLVKSDEGEDVLGIVLALKSLMKRFKLKEFIEAQIDPRVKGRSKYSAYDLIMSGMLMQFLRMGSRNNFDLKCQSGSKVKENIELILGVKIAHGDTVHDFLKQFEVDPIANILIHITKSLMESGVCNKSKYEGHYVFVIDGVFIGDVSVLAENTSWGTEKTSKLGKVSVTRSCVVLLLLGPGGIRIPVMWEPIEKQDGHDKQDCELVATHRLLDRFHKHFPRLKALFTMDGLFANGPMMQKLEKMGAKYVITFKEGCIPSLWKDYIKEVVKDFGAKSLNDNIYLKYDGETATLHREIFWVNGIEHQGITVDVLTSVESNLPFEYDLPNEKDRKLSKFVFLTNIKLTSKNALDIEKIGRGRWAIEDFFNNLKNRSSQIMHKFARKSIIAAKGYVSLSCFAECLETLITNVDWFVRSFRAGKKTIKDAWEALNGFLRFVKVTSETLINFIAPPTQLTFMTKTRKP